MLRSFISNALRTTSCLTSARSLVNTQRACYSHLLQQSAATPQQKVSLLPVNSLVPATSSYLPCIANGAQSVVPTRSVTKFSLIKGKRKSVKAVIKRFKRLDWGCWIHTHSGRQKKLFKKSAARKRRLRRHVFCNATQSFLLDKMVTSFWRRPKAYINDPYAPYHTRDEYFATKSKTFKV